jgi:hypothetical protein
MIAGAASRRRDIALVNEEFKGALGKDGEAYGALSNDAKEKIKQYT